MIRQAVIEDIDRISTLRLNVKENVLNNPSLVSYEMYVKYLTTHGKGWVWEDDQEILGFAIVDTESNNIWALFVNNDHLAKGIGKQLQSVMLDWYFSNYKYELWLSTSQNTRAARFYELTGWSNQGILSNNEIKFTMTPEQWHSIKLLTSSNG